MAVQFTRVYKRFNYGTSQRSEEGDQDIKYAYKNDGYLRYKGLIKKFPGYKEILDFGDTVVRYLTFWEQKSTSRKTYLAIVDDNSKLDVWSWNIGGQKTSLTGGAGIANAQGSKCSAGQQKETLVFGFSKTSPKQTTDAATIAALTGWPPVYPARTATEVSATNTDLAAIGNPWIVLPDKGRIKLGGDTNNIDEYYESGIFRPDIYTPSGTDVGKAGYVSITRGDNKGGIQWLSAWNNQTVVLKKKTTALISGYHQIDVAGNNPYKLATEPLPNGTESPHSVHKKGNDLFWVDEENTAQSVIANLANISDIRSADLSFEVQDRFSEIPTSSLPYVWASNVEKFNHLWVSHYKGFTELDVTIGQTLALWHLNGDLLDSSGRGLTLTNNGTAVHHLGFNLYRDGSIDVNGSSQWLSTTSSSNSGSPLTDLTCEVVIRPDTLPTTGNKSYIIREQTASGEWAIYLENVGGTQNIVFSVTDSGGTERKASYAFTTPTGWLQWTKIAGKWTGSEVQLFTNGTKRTTTACTSIKTSVANGISIGSSAVGSSANGYDGKIDEIRISGVEISDDNIASFSGSVSDKPNRVQVLDYGSLDSKGQPTNGWDMVTNQVFPTSMLYVDGMLFTGTADGKILLEYSSDTRNQSSREADYTLQWDDLSQGSEGSSIPRGAQDFLKAVDEIEVKYAGTKGGELRVSVSYYDRSSGGNYLVYLEDDSANLGWGSSWVTQFTWQSGQGRRVFSNKPKYPIYPYGFGDAFQINLHTHLEDKPIDIKEVIVKGRLLAKR